MRTTHVKDEVDDEEVDDEEVEENHVPRSRVGECLLQDGDEEPLERVLAVVRSGIITRDGGGEREIRCIRVMHFGVGGMRILSIPLLSRNGERKEVHTERNSCSLPGSTGAGSAVCI